MRALVLAAALFLAAAPALAQSLPAAQGNVRMPVPSRNIARGEIIAAADLTYANLPASRAFGGTALNPAELEGKQARRFLEAGEPVRSSDVHNPIVVAKGAMVTMTFTLPGIALTAVGKAVSEGGVGDTVTVLNPVSYRQISATVTGPGTVAAGPVTTAAAQIAAVNP